MLYFVQAFMTEMPCVFYFVLYFCDSSSVFVQSPGVFSATISRNKKLPSDKLVKRSIRGRYWCVLLYNILARSFEDITSFHTLLLLALTGNKVSAKQQWWGKNKQTFLDAVKICLFHKYHTWNIGHHIHFNLILGHQWLVSLNYRFNGCNWCYL